ncbi:hypothetical protein BpHYR1_021301 [Brachionus plicatilis]|uniref:Uncharacterized protein n=1 Tax=Brachionus plicatilis TaxID=10195 RepID=A0A3M7SEF0_BRAPC|nr:hypothetical protein BpHYR1_021301 [Brachionus plicatilis]
MDECFNGIPKQCILDQFKKYPLSDTEKLRYSHLLEQMAKISLQINSIDFALKFIIKCIEVLQDLFEVFNVSDLDRKFKTRMQFLQISNRLSLLHSNMALLLLKVNNLDAAGVLLCKAKTYNSEQLTNIIIKLDKKFKFDKSVSKNDMFIQEKNDSKSLIYRESLEEYVKNQKSNIVDIFQNTDDAGSYESKFHYLFISGLYDD